MQKFQGLLFMLQWSVICDMICMTFNIFNYDFYFSKRGRSYVVLQFQIFSTVPPQKMLMNIKLINIHVIILNSRLKIAFF